MAVAVASLTTQNYTAVTDVGSTGEFTVTKPSGLALDDMLFVVASASGASGDVGAPAGWTEVTIVESAFQGDLKAFYRVATAGDVSGGNFTFATTTDNTEAAYVCYRLTGTATSVNPILDSDTFTDSLSSESTISGVVSIAPPIGTLIMGITFTDQATSPPTQSNYSVTGQTLTFTERIDDSENASDIRLAVVDSITSATGEITDFSFDLGSSVTADYYINFFAFYPQQDANATLTTTVTGNTAFAPAGSAGANASLTLTETTNTAFDVAGESTSLTNWTNESAVDTTWTNEESL